MTKNVEHGKVIFQVLKFKMMTYSNEASIDVFIFSQLHTIVVVCERKKKQQQFGGTDVYK